MFKNERQNEILEILHRQGFTPVKELSQKLFTSESSIRRDLTELENQRIVKRSYGGAEIITAKTNVVTFGARSYEEAAAKRQIAAKAATLIRERDIVFLDQSSTCYFLALELQRFKELTVVTNNIEILSLLARTDITVHSSGGVVSKANSNCLIDNNAQKAFEEVFADVMFFSAHSVSPSGVISDCTQEEIFVRNAMMKNAAKKVFLCDSSKAGTTSSFVQCTLAEVDTVVCENNAFAPQQKIFKDLTVL